MRKRGKVDANQAEIVDELRMAGATVWITSGHGVGSPDLVVGWRGRNYLFEVKDGSKPPSGRRLTPDEQQWHNRWRGRVTIIETLEDAFKELESK